MSRTASGASPRPRRAGDIRHSVADISRAGEVLGYRPETALADGLGALVEHNRKGK
jgi:nucleoside-diphosphate-sugar epimerase